MKRSIKVSMMEATATKQRRLAALLREVRSCTQRYVDYLWVHPGKLDAATLNRVAGGSLSYRHRSNCLKIALETVSSTRKAAKALGVEASCPQIHGAIRLSSLVAKIEPGRGAFDYVLKISSLVKGTPIVIPFKSHKQLNYWLQKPGAKLLQGCTLGADWAALWVDVADQPPKRGATLGVDIGINKLLVDSNGTRYGTEVKAVCARVRRCKPKSKGRLRASRARTNYINKEVKTLPWCALESLGVENLKNLKLGKNPVEERDFAKLSRRGHIGRLLQGLKCWRKRTVFVLFLSIPETPPVPVQSAKRWRRKVGWASAFAA